MKRTYPTLEDYRTAHNGQRYRKEEIPTMTQRDNTRSLREIADEIATIADISQRMLLAGGLTLSVRGHGSNTHANAFISEKAYEEILVILGRALNERYIQSAREFDEALRQRHPLESS